MGDELTIICPHCGANKDAFFDACPPCTRWAQRRDWRHKDAIAVLTSIAGEFRALSDHHAASVIHAIIATLYLNDEEALNDLYEACTNVSKKWTDIYTTLHESGEDVREYPKRGKTIDFPEEDEEDGSDKV